MNSASSAKILFIILGDYLNACTLMRTIKDYYPNHGDVHVVGTSGRNMLPRLRRCDSTPFDPENDDIKTVLQSVVSQHADVVEAYLLPTSEQFHIRLWEVRDWLLENRITVHIGKQDPRRIIEKNSFSKIVSEKLGFRVPRNYELHEIDEIEFPVIVKEESSFTEGRRQIEKQILQSSEEYQDRIGSFRPDEKKGLIVQELLDTRPENNISVSGWYSVDSSLFIQTRKLSQYPESMGNGDVVEVMDLDPVLEKMTNDICREFDYHGPFEMEFLINDGESYVLEMNPRFWMQHGLLEVRTGGALLGRYCGIKAGNVSGQEVVRWCNPIRCLYRLIRLDFRSFGWLFSKRTYCPITLWDTFRWVGMHYLRLPL